MKDIRSPQWIEIEKALKADMEYKERIQEGRILSYIDARQVMDRLDMVVGPENWKDEYALISVEPVVVECKLTILGVTKSDVGYSEPSSSEPYKSAYSDALKRAAVKFGIGRFLYKKQNLENTPTLGKKDERSESTSKAIDERSSYSKAIDERSSYSGAIDERSSYNGAIDADSESAGAIDADSLSSSEAIDADSDRKTSNGSLQLKLPSGKLKLIIALIQNTKMTEHEVVEALKSYSKGKLNSISQIKEKEDLEGFYQFLKKSIEDRRKNLVQNPYTGG
jgi:hypothetical protein